jgi:hypothetical protein
MLYNVNIGAWRSGLARQLGVLEVARSNRVAPIFAALRILSTNI